MEKHVMLERVQITNLFDRFTYDIDLKNGYNISILIAPNGFGKTTVFNIVDCIFNPTMSKIDDLLSIPFESCSCMLTDNLSISVEKVIFQESVEEKNEIGRDTFDRVWMGELDLIFRCNKKKGTKQDMLKLSDLLRRPQAFEYEIDPEEMLNSLRRNREFHGSQEWVAIGEENLRDRLAHYNGAFAMNRIISGIKGFIEGHGCGLDVNFIKADRVHKRISVNRNGDYYGKKKEMMMEPLAYMQDRIRALYANTDTEYRKLVAEARDKLPKMYIEAKDNEPGDFQTFEKQWNQYTTEMDKFYKLGLVDSVKSILATNRLEEAYKKKGSFLTEYLKAFMPTLEPWRKQYKRLELFTQILNSRNKITLKQFKYGPEGLVLFVDGKLLPLACLSSGEKNDLIMFYNLIFNSEDGGLVLIDEPEISLHIEWQEEYLDWLLKICSMNSLQAIVATHSPNIVNGHLELYAKRGLQDGRS